MRKNTINIVGDATVLGRHPRRQAVLPGHQGAAYAHSPATHRRLSTGKVIYGLLRPNLLNEYIQSVIYTLQSKLCTRINSQSVLLPYCTNVLHRVFQEFLNLSPAFIYEKLTGQTY